jgi:acetoin utilization protein AcuB
MTKAIPSIRQFMTNDPITMSPSTTLIDAHKLMREKNIRHIPVIENSKVVAVVSDGDLYRAEAVVGSNPAQAHLRDVMSGKPYTVSPEARVDEVVREMATHKYGSAVVVDNGHVVGLFTAVDALGAFAELLETRLR